MYHVTDSVYLEIGDEFVYDNDREDISADCKVANFVRNDYKPKSCYYCSIASFEKN